MFLFIKIFKFILSARYKIEVKWLDLFKKDTSYLVLPSHVALVDPILLYCVLNEKIKVRPLASRMFYDTLLKPFFKLLWAIPVDDFEKDQWSVKTAKTMFKELTASLKQWDSILLYPQWSLARQWYQSIIGKKSAFYACQEAPASTKYMLVTIRGLWWSRSSMARTWMSPSFLLFVLKWIFFFFINLFVFVPKRKVVIEFTDVTKDLRNVQKKWLNSFNSYLEKIYNKLWEEKISYVSGFWLYNTTANHRAPEKIKWSIDSLRKNVDYSKLDYPKDAFDFVETKIRSIKPDYHWDISLSTNLVLDMYFDSLDMAELKSSIATHFPKSSNPPLLDLKEVGDLLAMATGKSSSEAAFKPCIWKRSQDKTLIYPMLKKRISTESTILSLFKANFKSIAHQSVCYDQLFGVQSTDDFLVKAYLIADILKKIPWKNIAIMLPSLSVTTLLIVACYLAKKIPVMLNWTQSKEAFANCVQSQNISSILTVKSFYEKIQTPWLKNYEMTFFEESLKKASLVQKVKALIASKLFIIPKNIDSTAVILFTSGSEALPKAVKLSHQNIVQNLIGTLGLLDIETDDVLLAFLPPFHSFWFTVNTILPLISGMRVVNFPDPNDSIQIASLIPHAKVTAITATPTFLKAIFSLAYPHQLSRLKFAVVWAERAPLELFSLVSGKNPNTQIIEWYWITECSPVIAANPFSLHHHQKKGTVGLPILWADIKILDLDTFKQLKPGLEWMIYVSGPFVFDWYVDSTLESPFHTIRGKRYYKTWDLWFLDTEWYLTISGRLKRFVKVAWEMISLPAIESILLEKYGEKDSVSLSLEAKEFADGTVKFVLFSISNLDLESLNIYLHQKGISNLVNIKDIVLLDEIPLLGSGKTDFMKLRSMIV